MARTRPCNSCEARSALKSASESPRIHDGRRAPRGRSPPLSGGGGGDSMPSRGGFPDSVPAALVGTPLVETVSKPFVGGGPSGGGSARVKFLSPPRRLLVGL